MKIEIWSDIMCPFCYIGKRKLEAALEQFAAKDEVEISWHSFQLDPQLKYRPGQDLYSYLSEVKGISRERSVQMHDQLAQTASENGLTYNFSQAIITNSFDAHRLIQLAKKHNLGDAAEERLFKAYFTEGKNVGDPATLVELGGEIGLQKEMVEKMLASRDFAREVADDIAEAQRLGIRGVPFFVVNRKYAVSGAQPVHTFLQTLEAAYKDRRIENPATQKAAQ